MNRRSRKIDGGNDTNKGLKLVLFRASAESPLPMRHSETFIGTSMRRISVMTLGIVMIFIGIQLNLVETYVLTPRFSNFLAGNAPQVEPSLALPNPNILPNIQGNNPGFNSPYSQASYGGNAPFNGANGPAITPPQAMFPTVQQQVGQSTFSTPTWLCWPVLFLGTVVFLHGFSMSRRS